MSHLWSAVDDLTDTIFEEHHQSLRVRIRHGSRDPLTKPTAPLQIHERSAHASRLPRPTAADWSRINRQTPRLVDVLPNGPVGYATVQDFLDGGVPEVMLHLRELELLRLDAMTVSGRTLGETLQEWECSERRQVLRARLLERANATTHKKARRF